MSDIKYPETLEESKKHFEGEGYKTIPIVFGIKFEKKPHSSFTHKQLEDGTYNYNLDGIEAIAMVHGPISGTFAIDIDVKERAHNIEEAIHVLFNDIPKTLAATLCVKTPKQGVHFIFESEDGVYPPQKKYYSKKYPDVEIDIRSTHGYTLIPPSLHPEKKYGNYSFISNTLKPAKMKWKNVEMIFARRGFFPKSDQNAISRHENGRSDYDLIGLLAGKFPRGKRRVSQNSLYCKLRIEGKTIDETKQKINEINQRCKEPLESAEVEHNCRYAEMFYQNEILNTIAKKGQAEIKIGDGGVGEGVPPTKVERNATKKTIGYYKYAEQLMSEYDFISHISGEIYYYAKGIYQRHGEKLIRKKCRQYWKEIGICNKDISEIISIVRDDTTELPQDSNQDIFDNIFDKIILKNGMYDFDKMEFVDWDPAVKSTIKHPVFFDSKKKCPKFNAFLKSCFGGDKVRMSQVVEMMALAFIKRYVVQKGYVNYGIGSNGKGTFLSVLRNMLGIQNTCSVPMQSFQKNQFVGFELHGKCANISADGGTEAVQQTGFIKSVLGGDAVRCEEKFHSPFDFVPFVTLIFTFNELPAVRDSSDGFARKIQPILWDKRFYGKDRDVEVDKIAFDSNEKSGIFNKLVPVIKRLLDTRQLQYENTVQETKMIWLSRSDSFFRFRNECITMGKNYRINTKKLREGYEKFCEQSGMTLIHEKQFFNKISEMVGNAKPINTRFDGEYVRMWLGFTLKDEAVKENVLQGSIDNVVNDTDGGGGGLQGNVAEKKIVKEKIKKEDKVGIPAADDEDKMRTCVEIVKMLQGSDMKPVAAEDIAKEMLKTDKFVPVEVVKYIVGAKNEKRIKETDYEKYNVEEKKMGVGGGGLSYEK